MTTVQGVVGGGVAWTSKQSKMTQPDLDFVAPDVQLGCPDVQLGSAAASPSSDVFSYGQLICALFNDAGRSLIQAEHNVAAYARQIDKVRPTHRVLYTSCYYYGRTCQPAARRDCRHCMGRMYGPYLRVVMLRSIRLVNLYLPEIN